MESLVEYLAKYIEHEILELDGVFDCASLQVWIIQGIEAFESTESVVVEVYDVADKMAELSEDINTSKEIKRQRDALLEALQAAKLSLLECAMHLMGRGPIPEPEAMGLTIGQVDKAIADAESE